MKDKDIYLANGTLYVPEKARWEYIKKNANQLNIGEIMKDWKVKRLLKEAMYD